MRYLPVALGALSLLTACAGTNPANSNNPNTPASSTGTTGQPVAGPTSAPVSNTLRASSTLSIDGKPLTAFEATPLVTFAMGAGTTSTVTATTGKSTDVLKDRKWTASVTFRSLKTKTGMTQTFKPEDIDRLEVKLEELIPDRYTGNKWEGTFDVPGAAKVTTKHEGDRVYGLIEATLQPGKTNEATSNKPVTMRFEFENEMR